MKVAVFQVTITEDIYIYNDNNLILHFLNL